MKKVFILKPAMSAKDTSATFIQREVVNEFPCNGTLGVIYTADVSDLEDDLGTSTAEDIAEIANELGDKLKGKAFRVTVTLEEVDESELFQDVPAPEDAKRPEYIAHGGK